VIGENVVKLYSVILASAANTSLLMTVNMEPPFLLTMASAVKTFPLMPGNVVK